jgi:hypothetical protein
MPTPLETAVAAQVLWKPGPILRAAVELVKAGLSELDKGHSFFGCDNVPEAYAYEGQGICGVATRMLIQSNLIRPSQYHNPEQGVFNGRRKSLRKQGHARRVDLYELASKGLAEAFVVRYDPSWQTSQLDWVDMQRKGELKV